MTRRPVRLLTTDNGAGFEAWASYATVEAARRGLARSVEGFRRDRMTHLLPGAFVLIAPDRPIEVYSRDDASATAVASVIRQTTTATVVVGEWPS